MRCSQSIVQKERIFIKKEIKELGFNLFFSHKVFAQLEIWRNSLPDDITEDEVKGRWATNRLLPESEMLSAQR